MHEGLLILEKRPASVDMEYETPRILFINNPIQKLVTQFINQSPQTNVEDAPNCDWAGKELFEPVWITTSSDSNKKLSKMFNESANFSHKKMSLEQIILVQEDEPKQKNCIYRVKKLQSNEQIEKEK